MGGSIEVLSTTLLALAVTHAEPGRSPYSMEPVTSCGTEARRPACALDPVCEVPVYYCKPPRWSDARDAWVRVETPTTAICRYRRIARAIGSVAGRLRECRDDAGAGIAGCIPVAWPGTTESFALSLLTVALHESGLREDVQHGHAPMGRGQGGGACILQVRPAQAIHHASWLPEDRRESIAADPIALEQFAKSLLGDDRIELERCIEVGGRMLARARESCGASTVPWDQGMFSMYGTGSTCGNTEVGRSRKRTLSRLVAGTKNAASWTPPSGLTCK